jgi:DNA-binding protein YbaB
MFDILSKLGEIKEKAAQMKVAMEEKSFTTTDEKNLVTLITNGKKDITSITLNEEFSLLSTDEQERVLHETINKALKESESFIINELKKVIPNIPGMNIFG